MKESSVSVSVVIPTHNRSDALTKTLSCLAKQDFNKFWEVIVVNNRCTDDTDEVVRRQNFPASLRLVYEETPGAAAARNRGAKEARGEILIFIDNDILVPPDFIRRHVETLLANPNCWFVGRVINPPELRQSSFGRYRDDLHESYYQDLPTQNFADFAGATGQNWAMRKDEFLIAGGFDDSYSIASCEDAELALRAREKGFRTMFNPKSVVVHNDWATTLDSFCRRQELYSISSVLLWKKYGESSFQIGVVKENSPVDWKNDSLRLIGKKIVKSVLASSPGDSLTKFACHSIERVTPDTRFSYRAYRTAVALAIFRGVREGFRRYAKV
ncbi:MAG: glycosyltransferase [Acidobacteriota bacterium]|nr:glycosyltransferase [Acidobacteriota bacterium]